jgi:TRAP-type uncharacterized transport system substrate-binding protein
MRVRRLFITLLLGLALFGCASRHRKNWSIAIASNNSKYESSAILCQELFSEKGYDLEIIRVASSVEAARMVVQGKADFTMTLSHSDGMIPQLGESARELRTVMPLFENALFIFYRIPPNLAAHPKSIIDLLEHSRILLEVTDSLSEQHIGLKRVMELLNIYDYEFVRDSTQATLMPLWGTFSGPVAKQLLKKKWNLYSMEDSFIEYARIMEPRLGNLTIPIRYVGQGTKGINTLLSTAFLLTGSGVDKTELYDVISMLYDNRVHFTSRDKSYMAIREDFRTRDLNFPLHVATINYLSRNEPTFLERHAEYYGLIMSLMILAFGFVQSARSYIARRKKDRIDLYFHEYLAIKHDATLTTTQRMARLEALQTKAINQMMLERLDIMDFNVFNQAIESERVILRITGEKVLD